ncbi:hypothetical protein ACTMTU_35370 [Streptomyces sp. OZ13]|uniref:hypothetical protein n=1 Tax=Streptomyces sp. OZ13 TaxID=3452210 RepID=UPI003F8CD85E
MAQLPSAYTHSSAMLLLKAPVTFNACVKSGSFPGTSTSRAKATSVLGTAHQWTANDPTVLAERVTRDRKRLWPRLAASTRRS